MKYAGGDHLGEECLDPGGLLLSAAVTTLWEVSKSGTVPDVVLSLRESIYTSSPVQ